MTPYYQDDFATIYHGDCRDVLPGLTGDVVLMDPPYGNGTLYDGFEDSPERVVELVSEVMPLVLAAAPVVLVTPGVSNMHLYPRPRWTLCWADPSGQGSGPWGFCSWQPVLAYGPDPYLAAGLGRRPDTVIKRGLAPRVGHPCPKPVNIWKWLIVRATPAEAATVLDPFMGSGTTLRAAKDLGRRSIGIEQSEAYCEIAAKRLAQEVLDFGGVA